MPRHQLLGVGADRRIIAKAGEPVHERLLAEPGELALGVAARGLGNCFRGGSERDRAFEVRAQFAVADEVERLGVGRNAAAHEAGNFLEPAAIEHRVDAALDALVQRGARRLQADLDRAYPSRRARPA